MWLRFFVLVIWRYQEHTRAIGESYDGEKWNIGQVWKQWKILEVKAIKKWERLIAVIWDEQNLKRRQQRFTNLVRQVQQTHQVVRVWEGKRKRLKDQERYYNRGLEQTNTVLDDKCWRLEAGEYKH